MTTTINNKNNRIDLAPIEATMNRFLVAMDDKLSAQQEKVNMLEEKLLNHEKYIKENGIDTEEIRNWRFE